ncbi:MAG TPA: DUF2252 family protein, partial [Terriglobia bacterium]|nr:DUF2252 family protein [Terriglobia bacterium]
MDIRKATASYEAWMSRHIPTVTADLRYKHVEMAESPFAFMRATFYRWVQLWKDLCPEASRAPDVLAVGDLHVENFGTWRDAEGRLIWGINDFDETCSLPYTNDLIRLGASARLAIKEEHLSIRPRKACSLILEGYSDGLRSEGRPFALGEEHIFLRDIARSSLRDPVHFWKNMRSMPNFGVKLAADQQDALELLLPEPGVSYQVKTRRAGLGSLGRRRLVAIASWCGGAVAREIKAALPSAAVWSGQAESENIRYMDLLTRAVRVPDPFVRICGNWIVRRLAPDCSRIEIASLSSTRDEARL